MTEELRSLKRERLLRGYQHDPVYYSEVELGVSWWQKQREVAEALLTHRRVLVKASHSVGKTHLAAGLVNWFFDCFRPSIVLTTAPTQQQVHDALWKEVRVQRRGRPGLLPKADRMETAPNHFAVGYTARDANAFQGRHEARVLIIFDEAVGIEGAFWEGAEGMMASGETYWLCIMNPTDTSSRAYEEELSGRWHVITIPAIEHPNIVAELQGIPKPYPSAVALEWVQARIKDWCTPLTLGDQRATDLEFPPGSGKWYRPGPLFESRVLGRWPSQGSYSVWSEAAWNACLRQQELGGLLQIGCDVARFGDDNTSFIVRRGNCVLHHETHNGWSTAQTAGRLKALAKQYAETGEDPLKVTITIDDDGVGGGVVDQAEGYAFHAVSGASTAADPEGYPNQRSEMWFTGAERAMRGEVDLTRLTPESRSLLRRQFMAPTYKLNARGQRVVEPKEETKKRIGRSPDDADAFNLGFTSPRVSEIIMAGGPVQVGFIGGSLAGGVSPEPAIVQGYGSVVF